MNHNTAIMKAEQAIAAAAEEAEGDLSRPVCHFRPAACWMNDCSGAFWYKGYYHIFYQHNPFDQRWGSIHWGHARSTDLVHWEHMPIALAPAQEKDEAHCLSGSVALGPYNRPTIVYASASIDEDWRNKPREQWIAISPDDELRDWERHQKNPVLTVYACQGTTFGNDMRDPFVFKANGRTFLIAAAMHEGRAVLPIYEAADRTLTSWAYRGILYDFKDCDVEFPECPNLFWINGKWLLLYSPYRQMEYMIGELDLLEFKFIPDSPKPRIVDCSPRFYAASILHDVPKDRQILFAWMRGFKQTKGWSGCMSLPRQITLDGHGNIRQQFIPELITLRGRRKVSGRRTIDGEWTLDDFDASTCELGLDLDLSQCQSLELQVGAATIRWTDEDKLRLAGTECDLGMRRQLSLHIFVDRAAVELIENGLYAMSSPVRFDEDRKAISLKTEGTAQILELNAWELKRIW